MARGSGPSRVGGVRRSLKGSGIRGGAWCSVRVRCVQQFLARDCMRRFVGPVCRMKWLFLARSRVQCFSSPGGRGLLRRRRFVVSCRAPAGVRARRTCVLARRRGRGWRRLVMLCAGVRSRRAGVTGGRWGVRPRGRPVPDVVLRNDSLLAFAVSSTVGSTGRCRRRVLSGCGPGAVVWWRRIASPREPPPGPRGPPRALTGPASTPTGHRATPDELHFHQRRPIVLNLVRIVSRRQTSNGRDLRAPLPRPRPQRSLRRTGSKQSATAAASPPPSQTVEQCV